MSFALSPVMYFEGWVADCQECCFHFEYGRTKRGVKAAMRRHIREKHQRRR